ncbi:MAG: aspartate--tRNA(Asn) ligase [Candidatus Levybacteria bacterium]|nr:aspartate--tRNA(Asn) ligase [Candidatus Levybacteria bacterium]
MVRQSSPQVVRNLAKECNDLIGKHVLLKGWVERTRTHGKVAFFDFRDRSGIIQVTAHENLAPKIAELSLQDVVRVEGEVRSRDERYINPEIETGKIEVHLEKLTIISKAAEMPFDMGGKELSIELPTLLDLRSLTLRHPKILPIFKLQEAIVQGFREILKNEGFTEIFVPTIVSSATEGGAEVFEIKYYDRKAYLAQSPQLYKQIMTSVFERVFTVAHAYRAEPSVTTRHLSEYISLDAEFGFIDGWTDLMDMAEKVTISIIENIRSRVQNRELNPAKKFNLPEIKKKILRVKLQEAQDILFKRTKVDHRDQPDLEPSEEQEMCQWALEETGAPFVFITHYPKKKRPFYTMPDPRDPEYTLSFDLIGISEEWVTGGQRINDYNMLLEHIEEWKNTPENFELYLQAFKYGMPPEGGFAMGLERITKDLLGLSNVREASLFPRDMERIDQRFSVQSHISSKK